MPTGYSNSWKLGDHAPLAHPTHFSDGWAQTRLQDYSAFLTLARNARTCLSHETHQINTNTDRAKQLCASDADNARHRFTITGSYSVTALTLRLGIGARFFGRVHIGLRYAIAEPATHGVSDPQTVSLQLVASNPFRATDHKHV